MAAIWVSNHPDVLAWWTDVQERVRSYQRAARKVERETGRRIMLGTGFGDDRIIGLASHSYREEPPPGWKYGWGKRDKGFFSPRATPRKDVETKADCEAAEALIKRLNDKHVNVRTEAHERFGTPVSQFFGLHCISPGFTLMGGRLWITFGTYDYQPKMPEAEGKPEMVKFFKPAKLSAYHKAREDAGIEDDDG